MASSSSISSVGGAGISASLSSIPGRYLGALPRELGPGLTTTFVTAEVEKQVNGNPQLLALVEGVKALYLCESRDDIFPLVFSRRAAFTDPAGHLEAKPPAGDATKNDGPFLAFKGLAELFRPTKINAWKVLGADPIRIEVDMAYQLRGPPAGVSPSIPFKTVLTLKLETAEAPTEDRGKVLHLLDEWKGDPLKWKEDGILGQLAEWRRGATGAMQTGFVKATGGGAVQSSNIAEPKIASAALGSGGAATATGQPTQTSGGGGRQYQ